MWYVKEKETMKLVKDKKHPDMYRVGWSNGDVSVASSDPKPFEKGGHYGFYNKTRAKEHLRREGIENYTVGITYNAPMARLEARGCV